ncbi:MAG: hypothetical protein M1827_002168 [Pycnora praestabilis]|nr:MAG: hypothetical protein M1827_002168 [Pycnora praestabilis]
MSSETASAAPLRIPQKLYEVLDDLSSNPYPKVPNPPSCKKRASVALIIRIQPHPSHWPAASDRDDVADLESKNVRQRLKEFFLQEWAQHGDPEVLFIKRAARSGDRWTSHVALPGGKRDPEDEDDRAVAIRETSEEVGLDLSEEKAIAVGNLPERVVTTSWGRIPLMVLCPFVFLLTRHDIPPLKLQPTEVGSTHWVSLRALLSPSLRTYEYADVSDRLAKQGGWFTRGFFRAMVGQMLFAAVRLIPSESLYCSSAPGFFPDDRVSNIANDPISLGITLRQRLLGRNVGSVSTDRPLLLWGLTLGILADFLELLPPHNAVQLWTYPTLTHLDVQFWIWALTYSLRKRKQRMIEHGHVDAPPAVELGLDAIAVPKEQQSSDEDKPGEVGIGGLGVGRYFGRLRQNQQGSRSSAVGVLLEGYYDLVPKAVIMALVARCVLGTAAVAGWWMWYRRRRV